MTINRGVLIRRLLNVPTKVTIPLEIVALHFSKLVWFLRYLYHSLIQNLFPKMQSLRMNTTRDWDVGTILGLAPMVLCSIPLFRFTWDSCVVWVMHVCHGGVSPVGQNTTRIPSSKRSRTISK